MKHLVIIISLLIMVSAFPALAAADDWDAYQAYNKRFYFLDQQDFNTITCHVESAELTDLINLIRQKVDSTNNIELVARLDEFSLKYSKTSGITIHRPELHIRIISEEGMEDPEGVREAVNTTQAGLTQAADGLADTLQSILSSYESDKREDLKNIKLVKKNGEITATYQKGNSDFTETFKGRTIEFTEISADGESHILCNLQVVANNKLILKDATVTADEQSGTFSMKTTISYQKVGNVVFPRQLTLKSGTDSKPEGKITLTNCTSD